MPAYRKLLKLVLLKSHCLAAQEASAKASIEALAFTYATALLAS